MVEFNLREACNNLLKELEQSFGKQNIIKLHIDLKLPNLYEGYAAIITEPIKSLASFLANNLVNGIILIELFEKGQAGHQVSIQVNITGSGVPESGISTQYKSAEQLLLEFKSLGYSLLHKMKFQVEAQKISLGFTATLRDSSKEEVPTELIFKNKKILLTEDNEINVLVFSHFLDDWGVIYTVATNGQEAIDQLKRNTFDAILMDIHMPVMDGIEAIRQLREFNSTIPVIVLSAVTYKKDIDEAFVVGANEYLKKPVSSGELYMALAKFL